MPPGPSSTEQPETNSSVDPTGGASLAEESPERQHPVLRRLRTGESINAGVRRAAAWAAAARLMSQVVYLLGATVTSRLLLPSDFGKAAVIAPITAFAVTFASLGLGSAVIHSRRVTEELLSTAFWLNGVAGVLLTALIAALSVPLQDLLQVPDLAPLLVLASLTFTIDLSIVHVALLERTLRFKQIAWIETSATVLNIGTVIVAAAAGAGAFSLVYGPLVYTLSLTILAWSIVRWRPHALPDRVSIREIWLFSKGITGFNFLNFWARNADNLALARFVSQSDLGFYGRAYNLMKLPVTQMNTMLGRVMFPALTRLRDDPRRLGQAWLRALSAATAFTAPIAVGMAVSAPALVEVMFGRRWLGMVTVLELLALAALPQTLTTTVAGLLRATGATTTLFRLGLVTSSGTLVAIAIGLPWGTVGVAAALLVKFYLEVAISMGPCLRQTRLTVRDLLRALRGVWLSCLMLAATGMAVRILLSGRLPAWQVLLIQVVACGVTYVGALLVVERPLALVTLRYLRRDTPVVPSS